MPKADFIPAITHEDVEDVTFDSNPRYQQTDEEAKAESLADALKGAKSSFVSIHREENGKNIFVVRLSGDKYDIGQLETYLQTQYGGGDYRVKLYVDGRIRANTLLEIASALNANTSRTHPPSGEIAQILGQVMSTVQQQNERIVEALNGGANKEEEFLQKMLLYKQLFDNGQSAQQNGGIEQLSQAVALLKDLGVSVGGQESEEKDGFGPIAEKLLDVVPAMMSQQPQKPQQPQQPQQPKGNKKAMCEKMKLKMGIGSLIGAARLGSDPAHYAQVVIDQIGEVKVREFITDAGAPEKLLELEPKISEHAQWFDELAEHVKATLGLESRFGDLYDDEENVINAENDTNGVNNSDGNIQNS